MKPEQFYDNLREQDRSHVKTVVEVLKKSGFDVYAAGSSLERKDYNDVDLVVVPHQPINYADARGMLDQIIEQHGGRESSLKVTDFDQKKVSYVDIEDIVDELSRLFSFPNPNPNKPVIIHHAKDIIPGRTNIYGDPIEYAGSKVEARYKLDLPPPFERELSPLHGSTGISIFDSLSDSDDPPFLTRDRIEELGTPKEMRERKTTIDICLSYKPFELVPTTLRIQL